MKRLYSVKIDGGAPGGRAVWCIASENLVTLAQHLHDHGIRRPKQIEIVEMLDGNEPALIEEEG